MRILKDIAAFLGILAWAWVSIKVVYALNAEVATFGLWVAVFVDGLLAAYLMRLGQDPEGFYDLEDPAEKALVAACETAYEQMLRVHTGLRTDPDFQWSLVRLRHAIALARDMDEEDVQDDAEERVLQTYTLATG